MEKINGLYYLKRKQKIKPEKKLKGNSLLGKYLYYI